MPILSNHRVGVWWSLFLFLFLFYPELITMESEKFRFHREYEVLIPYLRCKACIPACGFLAKHITQIPPYAATSAATLPHSWHAWCVLMTTFVTTPSLLRTVLTYWSIFDWQKITYSGKEIMRTVNTTLADADTAFTHVKRSTAILFVCVSDPKIQGRQTDWLTATTAVCSYLRCLSGTLQSLAGQDIWALLGRVICFHWCLSLSLRLSSSQTWNHNLNSARRICKYTLVNGCYYLFNITGYYNILNLLAYFFSW